MNVNHSNRKHALLSASGASRWLACTPSAKLEEDFLDTSSDAAKEGTLAHEFADLGLRLAVSEISQEFYDTETALLKQSKYYSREMPREVDKYLNYVLEQFSAAQRTTPDAKLLIEQKLDFSHVVPDGFGTGDAGIVADKIIELVDLKYGTGVQVFAEENPQLMLYALGVLREVELLYDIDTVKVTIVQPRLQSISSWEISVADLLIWAEDYVKPKAALAFAGEGVLVAGNHCRWCRVKAKCRAFAEQVNEVARFDFLEPMLLSEAEVIEVYKRLPDLIDWAKSVAAYLKGRALAGEEVKGYKLVEGRSNRKWIDDQLALDVLRANGYTEEEITNVKIKGLGDIGDLMSKDDFAEILSPFVTKPRGAPVLVPEADKRPRMDATEDAVNDFS